MPEKRATRRGGSSREMIFQTLDAVARCAWASVDVKASLGESADAEIVSGVKLECVRIAAHALCKSGVGQSHVNLGVLMRNRWIVRPSFPRCAFVSASLQPFGRIPPCRKVHLPCSPSFLTIAYRGVIYAVRRRFSQRKSVNQFAVDFNRRDGCRECRKRGN